PEGKYSIPTVVPSAVVMLARICWPAFALSTNLASSFIPLRCPSTRALVAPGLKRIRRVGWDARHIDAPSIRSAITAIARDAEAGLLTAVSYCMMVSPTCIKLAVQDGCDRWCRNSRARGADSDSQTSR